MSVQPTSENVTVSQLARTGPAATARVAAASVVLNVIMSFSPSFRFLPTVLKSAPARVVAPAHFRIRRAFAKRPGQPSGHPPAFHPAFAVHLPVRCHLAMHHVVGLAET